MEVWKWARVRCADDPSLTLRLALILLTLTLTRSHSYLPPRGAPHAHTVLRHIFEQLGAHAKFFAIRGEIHRGRRTRHDAAARMHRHNAYIYIKQKSTCTHHVSRMLCDPGKKHIVTLCTKPHCHRCIKAIDSLQVRAQALSLPVLFPLVDLSTDGHDVLAVHCVGMCAVVQI